jgi:hypothetical protein
LEENGDYPYYYFDGFSDTHLEIENSLCESSIGEEYHLACMCGRVLREDVDTNLPFFTSGGSFWTNDTNCLLVESTQKKLGETRNVCNVEGYQSVALIPLKNTEGVIGLLQLNDEAKDKFSLEIVEILERLGESIGIALARIDEVEHRTKLEKEREQLLYRYQLRIRELDTLYRISKLQENQDLTIEEILNLIVILLPSSTQFPEIAVARLVIEDKKFDSHDYRVPVKRYSVLIQNYGIVVGKLIIGYLENRPKEFKGPFLEEEVKLVNLVSESISRMLERKHTWDWRQSFEKYALILNDDEMRHITKLVLEDMAIGEMDREEYNIVDLPEGSTQTIESYMTLQYNLELNRGLIIKLQNLLRSDEVI